MGTTSNLWLEAPYSMPFATLPFRIPHGISAKGNEGKVTKPAGRVRLAAMPASSTGKEEKDAEHAQKVAAKLHAEAYVSGVHTAACIW